MRSDGILVELTSYMLAEYPSNPGKMKPSLVAQLIRALPQMGMTPVDRSRISVPGNPETVNKFAAFT